MRSSLTFLSLLLVSTITPICHASDPLATVPFLGCAADGQLGPVPPPKGLPKHIDISPGVAAKLAWYEFHAEVGQIGVLAPRGWACFATYGSNGMTLYVAPEHLDSAKILDHKNWHGFAGPAVQLSAIDGGTSGRFEVAKIAARVFPRYRAFVKKVFAEQLEAASDFHLGPFPADKLTYKSDHLVEFTTPSNAVGLGTQSWLLKGPGDINGFALIDGPDTDLLELNMRLPPTLTSLAPVIIQQAESGSH